MHLSNFELLLFNRELIRQAATLLSALKREGNALKNFNQEARRWLDTARDEFSATRVRETELTMIASISK